MKRSINNSNNNKNNIIYIPKFACLLIKYFLFKERVFDDKLSLLTTSTKIAFKVS